MNKASITTKFIFVMSLSLVAINLKADDVTVQTLSQGACWYEQTDLLKVVSFNDRESIVLNRDDVESQVEMLLNQKKKVKAITTDLALHCGGYGSSLVIKSEIDNRPMCLWIKFNKGKLEVRSLGGLEVTKADLCDGYKWGELIVGAKSLEQKAVLESSAFHTLIKSVSVISGTTLKVVLLPEHHGKEMEAMAELKKQLELRYIELNFYQHPVGESVVLK